MTNILKLLERKHLCEDYKTVYEGMKSSLNELSKVMSENLGIEVGEFKITFPYEERHPEQINIHAVIAGLPKTRTVIYMFGSIVRDSDGKARYDAVMRYNITNALGTEEHLTLGSVFFRDGKWEMLFI